VLSWWLAAITVSAVLTVGFFLAFSFIFCVLPGRNCLSPTTASSWASTPAWLSAVRNARGQKGTGCGYRLSPGALAHSEYLCELALGPLRAVYA